MGSNAVTAVGPLRLRAAVPALLRRHGFLLVAALLFAGPSLVHLIRGEWTLEQGAQGPIILASGAWLLWREARALPATAHRPRLAGVMALLVPVLLAFLFGRVVGMLWLEWLATYAALLLLLHAEIGAAGLARLWFPLAYLLFLVPPPYSLIAPITHSRKLWLSTTSVDVMNALGYEAAYNGTTLYIDQYELLIADACAGMNSLISLLAIGLFYIYVLHRADWRYAAVLAMLTVPIAMFANLVRILLLLLLTHHAGIAVAEGVLHETAGLVMFLVALGTLMLADAALAPLRRWLAR